MERGNGITKERKVDKRRDVCDEGRLLVPVVTWTTEPNVCFLMISDDFI